jgi:hypothetical protein
VKADISIWDLIHTSAEHRRAFLKVFQDAHVAPEISPDSLGELVGMISAPQALTFSSHDLSAAGTDHNLPLHITVQYKDFRVPLTMVDDGAGVNVCPLRTALKLGFKPEDIRPTDKGMKSFDETHHDALGMLNIPLQVGPAIFDVQFYVVDLKTSFNLLLGRPWLHKHSILPSTLHRMVKFWWNNTVVVVLAENFDQPLESVSAVTPEDAVDPPLIRLQSRSSDSRIRVDHMEPISLIPWVDRVPSLSYRFNPATMVKNLCQKWGYQRGTPLGLGGTGLLEPLELPENKSRAGLGYQRPHQVRGGPSPDKKGKGWVRFVSAGFVNPNQSLAEPSNQGSKSGDEGVTAMSEDTETSLVQLFEEGMSLGQEAGDAGVCVLHESDLRVDDPQALISTRARASDSKWYFARGGPDGPNRRQEEKPWGEGQGLTIQ